MDQKTALTILLEISKKYDLTPEEKEAMDIAIGTLSWTSLRKGWKQAIKDKRKKDHDKVHRPAPRHK